jgi:hypothetical protein
MTQISSIISYISLYFIQNLIATGVSDCLLSHLHDWAGGIAGQVAVRKEPNTKSEALRQLPQGERPGCTGLGGC